MNGSVYRIKSIFFLLFISFILILTGCQQKASAQEELVIPDVFEQNKRLGGGANVGSILYRWDIWDEEREKEELDLMKGLGLKGVRINTRPFLHAEQKPPYTLSKEFFNHLDWLVNEALEREFTVIIDEHQYRVMGKDPMGLKDIFLSTWQQMAEHYKDYPDNVYFGVLNEPNNNLTPYLWNYFLKEAYDIIRESNPARTLVIGPGNWNKIYELEKLELPEEDRNIIVEIHFYNPHSFTHQGVDGREKGVIWPANPEEIQALVDEFQFAAEWGKEHNRPLFLGEFGVNKAADQESAARWLRSAREQMEKHGMSWSLWNMMGSNFGMYDVEKKTWITSRKEAIMLQE
jgi:endoglucanase